MYKMPSFLLWGQEALATSMRGSKDAAAACALEFGLRRLSRFPGLREICRARTQVIQRGDPVVMDFFDQFGTLDFDAGGTGTRDRRYRRHVPEQLAARLGQLATGLGMSTSHLAILALMAAHLGAAAYLRPQYQACIVTTLQRFRDALLRRAPQAQAYANATADAPETATREYSMDDVLGPPPVNPSPLEED
ncbi:MAG: hypothetical protein ABL971_09560 [Vicinamibacterales bacterium]